MDLFIKIAVAVTIIAIASYANIDVIWAWVSSWKAGTVMIVTAIASIVIAGCALVATTVQGMQNRKHNRLSLRPLLGPKFYYKKVKSGKKRHTLILVNHGIGPAIIKDFILKFEGKEISRNNGTDYFAFLTKKIGLFDNTTANHCDRGGVVDAGERLILWEFEHDPITESRAFVDEIEILIVYNSLYKDEFFRCKIGDDPHIRGKKNQ